MNKVLSFIDYQKNRGVTNRLEDFLDILKVEEKHAIKHKNTNLTELIKFFRRNPERWATIFSLRG